MRYLPAFLSIVIGSTLASATAGAADPTFPARPVRLLVHNNPGSTPDVIARLVGKRLSDSWKQPVVIENQAGAAGVVATTAVVKAPADGHTLLIAADGPITILPAVSTSLPYDPKRDLAPVTSLGEIDFVLVANPQTGFKSLADLVQGARQNPGRINYASAGNGSPQHLGVELLKQEAGINLTHVPYNGGQAGMTGVIAGNVQLMLIATAPSLAQIKAGRLVALAQTGQRRDPLLPDVPTVAETYKGFQSGTWFGLFAPAATPRPLQEQIGADVAQALADPALRGQFAEQGVRVTGAPAARFREVLDGEARKYASLVKAAGIRSE